LNAAFPLWDELLGIRTLEWQLAGLGQLPPPSPALADRGEAPYGAGVALRLYAEDPIRQIPCPGLIRDITPPERRRDGDASIIWMTRYVSGQEVSWTSSGVIGELFVLGKDRASTIAAASRALRETWIAGEVQTNRRFLLEHLEHPFVRENLIHAGFTDEDFVPEGFPDPSTTADLVAVAQAVFPLEGSRWAAAGKWVAPDPARGPRVLALERFADSRGREGAKGRAAFPGGPEIRFHLEPTKGDRWLVSYDTWTLPVRRVSAAELAAPKLDPGRTRKILALAPGRVHALLRHPGETLQPRDRACMIESIGILVPHAVPVAARLLEWKVVPGEIVEAGRELAVFELLG
jgi:acetyl/propionyl-CoA carboxylase alpha subunit